MLAHTDRWLRAVWFGGGPLRFTPAEVWTDEFLDWDRRLDLIRPRELRPSAGWVAIREGVAEGPLVGGCLETICRHLRGSPAWLDLRGALLFLETSEEVPTPERVDAYLAELARQVSSSRSPGWCWGALSATTGSGPCGSGSWRPAGPRPAACRSSATSSAATPTPC